MVPGGDAGEGWTCAPKDAVRNSWRATRHPVTWPLWRDAKRLARTSQRPHARGARRQLPLSVSVTRARYVTQGRRPHHRPPSPPNPHTVAGRGGPSCEGVPLLSLGSARGRRMRHRAMPQTSRDESRGSRPGARAQGRAARPTRARYPVTQAGTHANSWPFGRSPGAPQARRRPPHGECRCGRPKAAPRRGRRVLAACAHARRARALRRQQERSRRWRGRGDTRGAPPARWRG